MGNLANCFERALLVTEVVSVFLIPNLYHVSSIEVVSLFTAARTLDSGK